MQRRIQNKIAESRWSLTITSLVGLAVWVLVGLHNSEVWPSMVCMMLAVYLMAELNNENALLRIYSRMVSCSFVAMMLTCPFLFNSIRMAVVVLCAVGFYLCAFQCYQDKQSQGWTFYAYLCIGLASIVWVQALFFVPVLWILNANNLLSMTLRSFVASLLGLMMPYWLLCLFYIATTGSMQGFLDHFALLASFSMPADISLLSMNQIISFGFIILCAVIGMVHFLRQSHNDSIRTRLLYQIFISVDIIAVVFLILQPQHFDEIIGIIIVNTAPLIGHYIALTHTRFTNITFKLLTLIAVLITAYNLFCLWMR